MVFFSGAVGVGLYGNDDVHNGMLELLTAARAIDDIIGNVKNQVCSLAVNECLVTVQKLVTRKDFWEGRS